MTIIWQAICKHLRVDHEENVERGSSGQHAGTPQSDINGDLRLHKDVFDLTLELIALKQEIDAAEDERRRVEEYLLPHKTRLLDLLERHQPLRTYLESHVEQENVELIATRIERMETGIEEIEREIDAKHEATERLRSVHDGIIRKIMRRTASLRLACVHSSAETSAQSLITETMVLAESLDTFEEQAAELEDEIMAQVAQQTYQDHTDNDDAVSFTSEDFDAKERIELMKTLGHLQCRRSELEEDPSASASAAEELALLTRQINDVGDQIAIRGAPCVEGSLIFINEYLQNEYEGGDDTAQHIYQASLGQDMNDVSDQATGPAHKATKEYAGPGLFDGVVGIEAPDDDSLSEEERFLTEAERIERFEKSVNKVKGWLNQLACAGKLHSPDAEGEVSNANFEGSNELEDVEWRETNSEYLPGSSDFAGVTLRCRIDSWSRICERFYRELDSEGQAAHPRGTSPV
ncbi:hypothetical protein PMZ80_002540 [Knufia obscura]|uniref:Uncharacterized protein n=1 Tax=Knufia obscura TaxID=1635080 RepID=A0ABR0RXK3_9EURO|nr:hypothetical protein PMZ80_002540 [Knufia obscura]